MSPQIVWPWDESLSTSKWMVGFLIITHLCSAVLCTQPTVVTEGGDGGGGRGLGRIMK